MVEDTTDIHSLSSSGLGPNVGHIPQDIQNLEKSNIIKETKSLTPIATKERERLDKSNTNTSTKSNRVALKDRRGLLGRYALLPEYEDPRNYPQNIKYIIVFIIAFAASCGPMGTSIILPAIDDVAKDLHTEVVLVNISVGIYLVSIGILPIWWSALSEKFGRRSIYIISFTMFFAFSVGCSLAPNISSLIVFRVLCGGCSASVQAVGAGTIADLYPIKERGTAMGIYYLGPLMGPFLAPIIGGAVAQAWGWRATQWVLAIASGLANILIIVALPETLRKQDSMANIQQLLDNLKKQDSKSSEDEKSSEETQNGIFDNTNANELEIVRSLKQIETVISQLPSEANDDDADRQDQALDEFSQNEDFDASPVPNLSRFTTNRSNYSRKVQLESIQQDLRKSLSRLAEENQNRTTFQKLKVSSYEYLVRPLHALVLLTYPPVILVITHSSICFGCIYVFNIAITYEYSRDPYNFSSVLVGLCYIPNSTTYVLASIIGGRWIDVLLRKYADTHNGELRPEARISWNLVVATILYLPSTLLFGWTIQYGVHWVVPLIGSAMFGFASMLVIGATVTYLVDTLPGKGATGVALNNLLRQLLAAIATFIVEPLIKALKPGILFSIVTGIIMLSSLLLVYLKTKGDMLRKKYDISTYYEKL